MKIRMFLQKIIPKNMWWALARSPLITNLSSTRQQCVLYEFNNFCWRKLSEKEIENPHLHQSYISQVCTYYKYYNKYSIIYAHDVNCVL